MKIEGIELVSRNYALVKLIDGTIRKVKLTGKTIKGVKIASAKWTSEDQKVEETTIVNEAPKVEETPVVEKAPVVEQPQVVVDKDKITTLEDIEVKEDTVGDFESEINKAIRVRPANDKSLRKNALIAKSDIPVMAEENVREISKNAIEPGPREIENKTNKYSLLDTQSLDVRDIMLEAENWANNWSARKTATGKTEGEKVIEQPVERVPVQPVLTEEEKIERTKEIQEDLSEKNVRRISKSTIESGSNENIRTKEDLVSRVRKMWDVPNETNNKVIDFSMNEESVKNIEEDYNFTVVESTSINEEISDQREELVVPERNETEIPLESYIRKRSKEESVVEKKEELQTMELVSSNTEELSLEEIRNIAERSRKEKEKTSLETEEMKLELEKIKQQNAEKERIKLEKEREKQQKENALIVQYSAEDSRNKEEIARRKEELKEIREQVIYFQEVNKQLDNEIIKVEKDTEQLTTNLVELGEPVKGRGIA